MYIWLSYLFRGLIYLHIIFLIVLKLSEFELFLILIQLNSPVKFLLGLVANNEPHNKSYQNLCTEEHEL